MSDRMWEGGGARPSTAARFSPSRALAGALAAQRDRWILWLPVGMILGAAGWMAWPVDPPVWLGAVLTLAGFTGACLAAWWPSAAPGGVLGAARAALAGMCALACAIGLGAVAAELRGRSVAQSAFVGSDEPVRVEGWVIGIDAGQAGPRLRLLVRSIEGVDAVPRFVRVSVPAHGLLTPGRGASCRAVLSPPSGPMAPGGYNFARRAYFERLGATGFGYGRCRAIALAPPPSLLDRARLRLVAVRADLSAAIQSASPGRGGAIAAALVAGDRSAIDQRTNETLQNSGLGHLLSVSGVHMGVVGGLVFALLLWTLSLIGPLALRVSVKKIAALGALIALAAYITISGFSVPALRSFIMAGVAFGAILIDRPAISMRGLALAAAIVVLIFPESVLEPGFQMSFAATLALVALFEMMKRPADEPALPTPGPLIATLQWIWRGIGGVIGVSLVAGLATDPFALYHFQRFSTYALAANLASAPIMSFLVAPAAAAAALLAPFGLAEWPLKLMAAALDLIAAIGEAFGSRPEAVRALPKPPDVAMLLCVSALLWACLWRGALRWGGAALFAGALALYVFAPRPSLAFDADFRAVYAHAVEDGEAHWTLMRGSQRSTYAPERLGAMLGLAPASIERLAPPQTCGAEVCVWRIPRGRMMAYVTGEDGFDSACVENAIVLARVAAPRGYAARCKLNGLMDAKDVAALGGGTIIETPQGIRITRGAPAGVHRPWTPSITTESADE